MTDISTLKAGESMPAVASVHALYQLGMNHDAVKANRDKLAGRPVGQVRALLANLEGEKPELVQTRLTEFGRKVKPL